MVAKNQNIQMSHFWAQKFKWVCLVAPKVSRFKRIIYDKETDAPTIYLYSQEMLNDLRNHIGDESLQPITIGLDRTFDLR